MKASTLFVSILGAILVAAALIYGIKAVVEQNQRTQKDYADLGAAIAKADAWTRGIAEAKASTQGLKSNAQRRERARDRGFIMLTQRASLDGQTVLEPGTKMEFVSLGDLDDFVVVIYDGKQVRIPISMTDLQ